jgi:Ala-tRNA(Pro) deacylase
MPTQKLQDYLDRHEIQYVTISHSPAYTAQRIAELTRIPGKELAKTVIVKIDDKFAMAVLPASRRVNLRHLQESIGADEVTR